MLDEMRIKCKNTGCKAKLKQADVAEHDLQCPKLKVTCIGCNKGVQIGKIENHQSWF